MIKPFLISILILVTYNLFGQQRHQSVEQLRWLAGKWNRLHSKEGKDSHERWEYISDSTMQGWGVTLMGTDTVFVEKLKIVALADGIFYVAEVAENQNPVYFKIIEMSEVGFVCENSLHDFPKKDTVHSSGWRVKSNNFRERKKCRLFLCKGKSMKKSWLIASQLKTLVTFSA